MSTFPLPPGKLPAALLATLLAQDVPTDPRVLIGPRVGEDAAVLDMGDRLLIAKSDPITFATDAIGHYAVTVNANDIAVMGGSPRWFLATLLLPETRTTAALVQDIFTQVRQACHALGIALVGGHTEITVGLERPILSGHMLGEVTRERLVTSAGVQVGDAILLTKGFPVEGVSIMARECAAPLAGSWQPCRRRKPSVPSAPVPRLTLPATALARRWLRPRNSSCVPGRRRAPCRHLREMRF